MTVIDTVFHLLFRCAHRRLTRPFTHQRAEGVPRHESYVVCLACAKQFTYDLKEMRIGKMIDPAACTLPPGMPRPRQAALAYALGVAMPVVVRVGAALRAKKPERDKRQGKLGLEPGAIGR
jgi:hypothetical protein